MYIIKVDSMLGNYEARELQKLYKEQIEEGVLVLDQRAHLVAIDEEELETE